MSEGIQPAKEARSQRSGIRGGNTGQSDENCGAQQVAIEALLALPCASISSCPASYPILGANLISVIFGLLFSGKQEQEESGQNRRNENLYINLSPWEGLCFPKSPKTPIHKKHVCFNNLCKCYLCRNFFFFFWWGRDNKILIINSFSKVLGRLWHRLLIQREFIERLKLLITYKQQKCFQAEHIQN